MIQRRQELRFALKPREPVGIVAEHVRQDFDGQVAIQLRVARAVDLTPDAQRFPNLVRAEPRAGERPLKAPILTDPIRPPDLPDPLRRGPNFSGPGPSYLATQGMSHETWQEQLRRGSLDLAILLTVSVGPSYGLAIIQRLEGFTDLVVTEGTIYPILGRLTRDGLLDATWVEDEGPHPRKYYRLTRAGVKRLDTMKTEWRAFIGKIGRLMDAAETSGT